MLARFAAGNLADRVVSEGRSDAVAAKLVVITRRHDHNAAGGGDLGDHRVQLPSRRYQPRGRGVDRPPPAGLADSPCELLLANCPRGEGACDQSLNHYQKNLTCSLTGVKSVDRRAALDAGFWTVETARVAATILGRTSRAYATLGRMPRNRQTTPRDHRVTEVVAAAKELFLTQGVNKTAMTHIAQAIGVANAAIYWYFPSKDDLLAEVFTRAVDEEVARLRDGPADPFERLIKGLIDLRPYRQMHMTIHDRMNEAESLVIAHDKLLDWIRRTVVDGLAYHGCDPVADAELVELVVVLFEGSNVPGVQGRTATDVIQVMIDRLVLQPARPPTTVD
jgi:AcrR family transcriptional regulator